MILLIGILGILERWESWGEKYVSPIRMLWPVLGIDIHKEAGRA